MKSPSQLFVFATAMAVTGCAALVPERPAEQNASLRLDRGLAAAEAGLYQEAFEELAWVYSHCPAREAGNRALVALAALELDPRNEMARPAVGTELLGRLIQTPEAPDWVRPLAETTFLTALALGAPHPAEDGHPDEGEADALPATDAQLEGEEYELEPAAVVQRPDPAADAVYGCGRVVMRDGWTPPALPTLPGPSMARLLSEAEQRRESAAARADTLQAQLTAVTEQLEATRAELERIRKTLTP